MASTSKKRRAAHSPSRSDSTKKARQASTTASLRSQRDSSGQQISRAKSVFRGQRDPYFPHNKQGDTPLPTGDDYLFRIQVISTTNNLNTDVFKKAVQGLVKICFPQDVLEEIGIEVVTQHMQSEGAPEENIAIMKDMFRSEMIHRVTWMLAEYLDRPTKVEASVKAIMAASASLHGAKIGEDVLGDVMSSLEALKEKIPGKSTERLAHSTDMETLSFRVTESDTTESDAERLAQSDGAGYDRRVMESPERSLEAELQSVVHAKRYQKNGAPLKPKEPVKHTREGKQGMILTSWRWNVQDVASIADVSEHFKRTSDLFAYHALPIVKQRLGAQATRKELRQEIEVMLMSMPPEEFEKWAESFDKLKTGDNSMLDKIMADSSSATNRTVSATPAQIVARESVTKLPKGPDKSVQHQAATASATETSNPRRAMIKREMNVKDEVAALTPAAEYPRSDGSLTTHGVSNRSTAERASTKGSETPVIDLLWGPSPFNMPYEMVVQTIMENLDKRGTLESFGMSRTDGEVVVKSKSDLRSELFSFRKTRYSHSPSAFRLKMEVKLTPWAVASLNSFPELNASPNVFLSIVPDHTCVLDLICDVSMPFHSKDALKIQSLLLTNLRRRGIVGGRAGLVSRTISNEFLLVLTDANLIDQVKRHRLERVLRRTAFSHKSEFRDLKNTTLVQAWEHSTGLTCDQEDGS